MEKKYTFAGIKNTPSEKERAGKCAEVDSLLPHNTKKQSQQTAFFKTGHNPDTFNLAIKRMKPPSKPKLNTKNPKDWFIYFNHDVPFQLWEKYRRKRMRFKIREDINRHHGKEREEFAVQKIQVWNYMLFTLKYNPFEKELKELSGIKAEIVFTEDKIENEETRIKESNRYNTPIQVALEKFIQSRHSRKIDPKSIMSYQSTVDWILEGLRHFKNEDFKTSALKHIHYSGALDYIADKRKWKPTTINKAIDFLNSILNWFETEDYVVKNPSKNKFIKLNAEKKKHAWYNREMALHVKDAVLKSGKINVYRAMQFTYWLMIRSKKELMMLRVADIDRTLKRVHYSSELSKNNSEQYRDYPPEFDKILDEMELHKFPAHYYVFGKGDGLPGVFPVSHNFFSKQFKVIKDKINLPGDYTIYGWKHTRIVHELMKGTEGPDISHMARHSDFKTTKDYLRDYDITLKNIYKPEDLTF